ncbi:unnamed protein product [Pleuronectes platessa]|uniref:Uncharacterized protein n=1 Tax=Pleuronectes platessa TaxID=8262 RepID=A0A9N7VA01_PLEPL|nr:unnamed protein product [Pleuronectes platessa]
MPSPCVTISVFVVNPLGTSCGWGSSRPVALLTTPPEARCAARLDVFLGGEVLIRGAGAFLLVCRGAVSVGAAEGGDRLEGTEGTAVGGSDSGRVSVPSDHLSYSAQISTCDVVEDLFNWDSTLGAHCPVPTDCYRPLIDPATCNMLLLSSVCFRLLQPVWQPQPATGRLSALKQRFRAISSRGASTKHSVRVCQRIQH